VARLLRRELSPDTEAGQGVLGTGTDRDKPERGTHVGRNEVAGL
jgi:hypothetical protein